MTYPYRVVLSEDQRAKLRGLVGCGVAPTRRLTRDRILLKADHGEDGPGWADAAITGALGVDSSTVLRVRRQFVTEGLAAALEPKRSNRISERALDGEQEAKLIVLACSESPEGADRWSLCSCWPMNWLAWRLCPLSRPRPCARRSQKRGQAVARGTVSARPDRRPRVRVADRGCARSLSASIRSGAPGRLPG